MDVPQEKPKPKLTGRARQVAAKRSFIAAFRDCASVKVACQLAKINRSTVSGWRKHDASFRALWEEVQDETAQSLEDEAVRRAYEGIKRPIYYRGKPLVIGRGKNKRQVYDVEYSDQLLIILLKRYRPHLYRETTNIEHSGSINLVEKLTAARERLIQMEKQAAS